MRDFEVFKPFLGIIYASSPINTGASSYLINSKKKLQHARGLIAGQYLLGPGLELAGV